MTRIAVVKKDKCSPARCGELCLKKCPVNRTGKECIVLVDGKAFVNEELCNGCGICQKICPFEAVHIINLPEALKEDPIHRYGPNGFALYSLPTPVFGKVVGVLGKNGIGKTTAIKILAGVLKPNLGKDTEASYRDLIERFKGTEAQKFFEAVQKGKIKIAYKPQAVDLIPRTAKGKVKELLRKIDEKGEFDRIINLFELEKILDTDIDKISGGELQRVAIAATFLKKANLYIFDEPTSYLDIKQRIKISKLINNLANESTAVLVIDHDLIILDYMADLVHLMYGKEGCFGVVSMLKTTRTGINVFLSGYLREENVRFRNYEIKFEARAPVTQKEMPVFTSWRNIEKTLGRFELKAKKGEILKHQVVGVLGENGIGKTSFVKILAGIIKQDKGEVTETVKVSYKPQYLRGDSREIVKSVLKDVIEKYETQLSIPLKLESLMDRHLNQLSGGELQRVSIALTLSKDADLYLLDEPSAYLDVEQRLTVSKVIRSLVEISGKSAMIVDHDLLFIDYLSDNLIVFEGVPAVRGEANGPFVMEQGMNMFLKDLKITMRRDPESMRPRVNKQGSQLDQQQKKEGKLYYS
ncbi:ribosome biogenesis/translation initiation ATPase RLI [Candidatus Woesearchaeota archaeon]|nr:MAG: ribosome biogenesis/translation initiation ATPase RLI [Candidatus Woesearchaeota archaeon]